MLTTFVAASLALADVPPRIDGPDPVRPVPPGKAGFSPSPVLLGESAAELREHLDGMARTGARWLRLDFDWSRIEPRPNEFDWSETDRIVHRARRRGMRILALVGYTPEWARLPGTTSRTPPVDPTLFARFLRTAVERYSQRGVKTWEIWNEPNISGFWRPRPDPTAYAQLLTAAGQSIKETDPQARVVTGGLAPAVDRSDGTQIAPLTFLKSVYEEAPSAAFDDVAIHPYTYPAMPSHVGDWNTFLQLPRVHELMTQYGDGDAQIWLTEFGAPTGTASGSISEEAQARYLAEAYALVQQWKWAGPLFWYSFRDLGSDLGDKEFNFGLVRFDGTAKPSLRAFKKWVAD